MSVNLFALTQTCFMPQLVVHTLHKENQIEIIRVISARKATKQERLCYEQAH